MPEDEIRAAVIGHETAQKWLKDGQAKKIIIVRGRIINVASTSVKVAMENMVLSNVFRNGVAAFAKTLSLEYANNGIRVHTLLPGPFMTNRVNDLGRDASKNMGISFDEALAASTAVTHIIPQARMRRTLMVSREY